MRHFSGVRNEEEKTFFDQNFLRFFLLKSLLSLVFFCLFSFLFFSITRLRKTIA